MMGCSAGISGNLGDNLAQLGVDHGEKGADDPGIPLVSRQFRLTGEFAQLICPDIG